MLSTWQGMESSILKPVSIITLAMDWFLVGKITVIAYKSVETTSFILQIVIHDLLSLDVTECGIKHHPTCFLHHSTNNASANNSSSLTVDGNDKEECIIYITVTVCANSLNVNFE